MKTKHLVVFSNIVILGAISLGILILASNIYNRASYDSGISSFLYYYIFPSAITVFFLSLFKLRPSYRINASLLIFSSVGVLCLAEYILQSKINVHQKSWAHDGNLTKLEVIIQLRINGIEAYPAVHPYQFLGDSKIQIEGEPAIPLGGISDKFTVFCNEVNEIIAYDSDEYGFNNPKGVWNEAVNIVAVGDSFTHGNCVPCEYTIAAKLRDVLGLTVSLGMGGNGPLMELGALKEYLPYLSPKVVLWLFYEGNDLGDIHREKADFLLQRYLERNFSQGLFFKQDEIDQRLIEFVEKEGSISRSVRNASQFFSFIKFRKIRAYLNQAIEQLKLRKNNYGKIQKLEKTKDEGLKYSKKNSQDSLIIFEKILLSAHEFVRDLGGEMVFVYLPMAERYSNPYEAYSDRQKKVIRLVKNLGLRVIDIHTVFLQQDDPLDLFLSNNGIIGHYNIKGYKLVSEVIEEYISDNKLLSKE